MSSTRSWAKRPKSHSVKTSAFAVTNVDHLATIVRNRLKCIQYRPDLLAGFLTQTGLTLELEPP
jgi:hypothetical protein